MSRRSWTVSFQGLADVPERPLSVDGMAPAGPNLSHWPGNRTPPAWKRDLSTGICLAFARATAAEQDAFVGGTDVVLNDHYDTDGFLSLLAVVRPEVALAREECCLAAAATGDYQAFHTLAGFAIDRIVKNLRRSDASPLAGELAGLTEPHAALRCYRWLLEHAETVLDRPDEWRVLWEDEAREVLDELHRARTGAITVEIHPDAALAVVRSREPLSRITLNTLARAFRVLHVLDGRDGPRYRYHDRTESWFELATFAPPPRRDLRPLRDWLQQRTGAAGGEARWCADPPDQPVPELYHGIPAEQEYGEITRILRPCRRPATDAVVTAFREHLSLG